MGFGTNCCCDDIVIGPCCLPGTPFIPCEDITEEECDLLGGYWRGIHEETGEPVANCFDLDPIPIFQPLGLTCPQVFCEFCLETGTGLEIFQPPSPKVVWELSGITEGNQSGTASSLNFLHGFNRTHIRRETGLTFGEIPVDRCLASMCDGPSNVDCTSDFGFPSLPGQLPSQQSGSYFIRENKLIITLGQGTVHLGGTLGFNDLFSIPIVTPINCIDGVFTITGADYIPAESVPSPGDPARQYEPDYTNMLLVMTFVDLPHWFE